MLSERNTGSNWVAALLKVTSPVSMCRGCWAAWPGYFWAPLTSQDPSTLWMCTHALTRCAINVKMACHQFAGEF